MPEDAETSPIEQLRNEFQEQFAALKASFEESNKEKDEKILQLEGENKDLHKALLQSAFTTPPAPKEPEKTEEQLYAENIENLFQKSKKYQEMI